MLVISFVLYSASSNFSDADTEVDTGIVCVFDYINVSFRLNSSSSNTVVSCLIDEIVDVRYFCSKTTILQAKRCIKNYLKIRGEKYTSYV